MKIDILINFHHDHNQVKINMFSTKNVVMERKFTNHITSSNEIARHLSFTWFIIKRYQNTVFHDFFN